MLLWLSENYATLRARGQQSNVDVVTLNIELTLDSELSLSTALFKGQHEGKHDDDWRYTLLPTPAPDPEPFSS